ncbi:cilia- and flagella-associated protein 221 [Engraulis encrasicolus]|uniref:cilia- and flagella-associated protein 221 n=1 Tax=Engraulis encrasicolus TaxID=184585 RepID=UPI002FD60197
MMEVVQCVRENFTKTTRKKAQLPLVQLVEDARATDVPHHLLATKSFSTLKSNNQIQAEPSEIHFNGFEVGQNYKQVLKLINISSDVMDIHIIPTQTKYFQTAYSKKDRLVPGLCYTLKLSFFPDEWRYFYDCIRIHCKSEENLLIPIHAYPVIDDLDIPSHVSLPAVSLGQSVSYEIPLSCSCPVDFEFEVFCLESSEAFSIQPLSGVIPARDASAVVVTYAPLQHGSAQVTIQLVISQFNSRPYVCTLSGRCLPKLPPSEQMKHDRGQTTGTKGSMLSLPTTTRPKLRAAPIQLKNKEQKKPEPPPCQKAVIDVRTPAGAAKLLMKHQDRLSITQLKEAMSHTRVAHRSRQVKEALFEKQVKQDVQEERANRLRWQVHLGKDPLSTEARVKILEQRTSSHHEYRIKNGELTDPDDFTKTQTNLSTRRVVRNAGQVPDCVPNFQIFFGSHLEIRHRALRTFQQAARKIALRCRMNRRLALLRQSSGNEDNLLIATDNLNEVEDEPGSEEKVTSDGHVDQPAEQLETTDEQGVCGPLSEELSGADVSTKDLSGGPKEDVGSRSPMCPAPGPAPCPPEPNSEEEKEKERKAREEKKRRRREERKRRQQRREWRKKREEEEREEKAEKEMEQAVAEIVHLSFRAPGALAKPPPAHPLRIFNPCPGLHAYRPNLSYMECDLEYHLCPLPKYTVTKSDIAGVHTVGTQKRFLDRATIIGGVMTWNKLSNTALSILTSSQTLTTSWAPHMSDALNPVLLPEAPPPLRDLPHDMRQEVQHRQ